MRGFGRDFEADDGGLTATGSQLWSQDSPGIPDAAEAENHFGAALAAGDNILHGLSGVPLLAVGSIINGRMFPKQTEPQRLMVFGGVLLAAGSLMVRAISSRKNSP